MTTPPKDHERSYRAGDGSAEYNLELNTALPRQDAIMRNKKNKLLLTKLLTLQTYTPHIDIESASDGLFGHD